MAEMSMELPLMKSKPQALSCPLQPVASLTVFCPISSETLFLLSYNFYTMVLLDKAFLNNLEW